MKNITTKTCVHCDTRFETHLSMKKYCNADCQANAIGFRRLKHAPRPFPRDPEYAAAELALEELQALEAAEKAVVTPRYSTLAGTPEVFDAVGSIRGDVMTGAAPAGAYGTHTGGLGVGI